MVEERFENEKSEYENRIQALLSEKSEFEDRIHNLISDLELKQLELNQLKGKIGELENQVLTKTWAMDRQEAEMTSAVKESEHVRQKLRRLEAELTEFRLKNSDLTEELVRKIAEENKRKEDACDFFKIRELEEKLFDANEKIKALEEELNGIKRNQEVAKEAEKIKKAETEVEMKIMREALDEALKQKSILQKRFESEFNQLRNVNTAQEQQLLDDFEWKLREVEQSCKKKILEAEKSKRELEAQVAKLTSEVEEFFSVPSID
ncbi:coiled-coil domain-containing protein 18-like [Diaphorina citri]|uniref:Coiled-coil domain-containing protein 18-like n=1 Tax=Diaphorina citri TaxID=121845 RepID=A0A3Q0IMT8_DIACI|nr:coiled-coil domain-containing protein 18-like [Diaphorina citri]